MVEMEWLRLPCKRTGTREKVKEKKLAIHKMCILSCKGKTLCVIVYCFAVVCSLSSVSFFCVVTVTGNVKQSPILSLLLLLD